MANKDARLNAPFATLASEAKAKKREAARAHAAAKIAATRRAAPTSTKPAKATAGAASLAPSVADQARDAKPKGAAKGKATHPAQEGTVGDPRAARRASADGAEAGARPSEGPLAEYAYEDRVAFHDAFADVRPLDAPAPGGKPKKPRASGRRGPRALAERAHRDAAEEEARARLDRLVAEGVRFTVSRDEGSVEGRRRGVPDRTLLLLRRGELTPEARVDLHGLSYADALRTVRQFVRDCVHRGRLTVLLIHGKGAHSDGGVGVLAEACVEVLTKGGAAPFVDAFASAPARFGGEGALLVRLRAR
ncbi:MAG: Smr/MutS family protein [Myxococcales bacterium]|nr:Smr/MutS family protein [Myxococcales bacterium]